MIGVALGLRQRCRRSFGQVPETRETLLRGRPSGEQAVRIGGARADIEPAPLRDVPGIAAEVVLQQQLGLTISAHASRGDFSGVCEKLQLFRGHERTPLARKDTTIYRAVRAARSNQEARAEAVVQRPKAITALDAFDSMVHQLGATAFEQELI